MRPIVDKRVDDSPEYNVARDRFLGTTTSATNSSPTLKRDGTMGAVKKPFGFVQYYGGDKEMVFTPNSPNKSRLSTIQTTTTKNHHHHHHYPLKCLDANAILMASPSLNNKTNATSGDNTTRRNNSMVFGRYDEKSDTMTTTNKRGNNNNKRDDDDRETEEEEEETKRSAMKNTFTPEISSSTTYANTQNQSKIPTSPVLSLLRTMFSSWNYPNNGTTVIAAEDILSPAADTAKFECGRTPKSSPVDFNASCDDNTHETAFANALFISEASKRLQKICNDQRTRALLDASANGISPGSSRILIDEQICGDGGGGSNSSDDDDGKGEEVESVHPSPKKEEVIVAVEQEREYSETTPITPMSSTSMPTRALFSSPGKASLTDDDDDEGKKLEMTTDDDDYDDYDDEKYMLFYAKLKTAIKIAAERYIRAAKRCSGDKVARENFCYKLWHHEAFSELFLSATFTALCELSLRLRSAIVWNATNNGVEAVGIESAYFLNYYVDQIGKCLGTAMTTAASSTSSSHSTAVTTTATMVRNYDDKFIYSCVAYAIAYVFVHSLFFLFRVQSPPRSDKRSLLHSSLEQKISLFQQKLIQNFTPVKRFIEKKKARWDLVRARVDEDERKDV